MNTLINIRSLIQGQLVLRLEFPFNNRHTKRLKINTHMLIIILHFAILHFVDACLVSRYTENIGIKSMIAIADADFVFTLISYFNFDFPRYSC